MNIIKYGTNDMLKFFMNKYSTYNLDEYDQSNIHALFYLIKRKDLDVDYMRSFLIRCNRDINIWSQQYGSLLFHTIHYKNMLGFTLLLSMGADVNGIIALSGCRFTNYILYEIPGDLWFDRHILACDM